MTHIPRLVSVTVVLSAIAAYGQAPAPGESGQTALSPSTFTSDAIAPAFALNSQSDACPSTTFSVSANNLVNQTETQCVQNGTAADVYGRFGRRTPFGFTYADNSTQCKVYSVTIAVQAGVSCTGLPVGGNMTFNGQLLPQKYRFPYTNEYNQTCSCAPVAESPVQVFSFDPGSSYCSGCNNTFSILGSTGSNGLRPVVSQADGGIYAIVVINQWIATNPMNIPRTSFGWVKERSEKVLSVGGISVNGIPVGSSEEYDQQTGLWSLSANSLQTPVYLHSVANLLEFPDSFNSYYIVSAGGIDANDNIVKASEVYNTTNRTWSEGPEMNEARSRFQLTSLYSGTNAVVATGGLQGFFGEQVALSTSETFDFDTQTWQLLPNNMTVARYRHNAVLLQQQNQLLVIGGQGNGEQALNSTEALLLDIGNWTTVGSLNHARYASTATVLTNGSVLVTGGAQAANAGANWTNAQLLSSCEIYNNGTWYTTGSLHVARADHEATLLSDGTVLVAGGGGANTESSSEIWNPRTGKWVPVAPMYVPRVEFGLVTFSDDVSIAFGGATSGALGELNGTTASALFTPAYNYTQLASTISPVAAPELSPALSPAAIASTPSVDVGSARAPGVAALASSPSVNPVININYETNDGLSAGAVAGIVGGAVGGVALLALLVLLCCCLRKKSKQRRSDRNYKDQALSSNGHHAAILKDAETDGYADPSQNNPSPSDSGILSMLSSVFTRKSQLHSRGSLRTSGSRQEARSTHSQASSVELPKGLSSPFDAEPRDSRNLVGVSQRSIEMRHAVPSPFGAQLTSPLHTQSSAGRRSAGDPLTGASWDPSTQNTARSNEDAFDATGAHQLRSKNLDGRDSGRSVLGKSPSQIASESSYRSELSKVSMTIQNELHSEWKIDRNSITLGRRLGKGGFGEVFEGSHHGSSVAVKVLQIDDERSMLDACHEFSFLHGLRHGKLVISYGACVDGNKMLLVMERLEEDLFHAIARDETCANDSVLWYFRGWRIAMDVASALVFLHSKGLVHLDVKSLNILLKGNRTEAKLGDLGLAKLVPDGHLALQNTLPGTPAYSAPEVMQAQLQWRLRTQGRKDHFKTEVGTPADIFAFGVVLFEICTGQHPARWRQDFTGEFRPEQAPPAIAKLVDDCLNDDPALRPTAQEVLKVLLDNKPSRSDIVGLQQS